MRQQRALSSIFAFVVFACIVKAGTANQLSATFGTMFLLAIRMMVSARYYIAIGTAEPVREMSVSRIIGYSLQDLAVRVFNKGIPRTGRNGCVRHFLLTFPTNSHNLSANGGRPSIAPRRRKNPLCRNVTFRWFQNLFS
jgi:hypothetical protein